MTYESASNGATWFWGHGATSTFSVPLIYRTPHGFKKQKTSVRGGETQFLGIKDEGSVL